MQKHGGKDERTVRQDPMETCVPRQIVEPKQGLQLKVKHKKKNMVNIFWPSQPFIKPE